MGAAVAPNTLGKSWPTTKRIAEAQTRGAVESDTKKEEWDIPLYVNVTNKILLSTDNNVTNEIIAISHQGDHVHRSAKAIIAEFRQHFTLHGLNKKNEENISDTNESIKTKKDNTVPRPMWYMDYATRPFEYIHIDFSHMPEAANGCKHVLIITDDFSLTTTLHASETADASTVTKVPYC